MIEIEIRVAQACFRVAQAYRVAQALSCSSMFLPRDGHGQEITGRVWGSLSCHAFDENSAAPHRTAPNLLVV